MKSMFICAELLRGIPAHCVGDYCFYKGASADYSTFYNLPQHFEIVVVTGPRGVGKSVFARAMSKYRPSVIFIELQSLHNVSRNILDSVTNIIELKQIK